MTPKVQLKFSTGSLTMEVSDLLIIIAPALDFYERRIKECTGRDRNKFAKRIILIEKLFDLAEEEDKK